MGHSGGWPYSATSAGRYWRFQGRASGRTRRHDALTAAAGPGYCHAFVPRIPTMSSRVRVTLDSTVVALKDALSSDVGGETVILHFSAGTYFGLDEVGTRVWQLVQQPCTVREIRDRLLEEYEVDPARCEESVIRLLSDLAEHGLVTVDAAPAA